MKVYFKPKTTLGKWSIGLILGVPAFFLVTILLIALGQRSGVGDTFFSNLALAIPVLLVGISGIAAFFIGIIGIIKSKDRSVAVFIATIIGFFILLFVLAEVLFPH
jgi:hypothetical protein